MLGAIPLYNQTGLKLLVSSQTRHVCGMMFLLFYGITRAIRA